VGGTTLILVSPRLDEPTTSLVITPTLGGVGLSGTF